MGGMGFAEDAVFEELRCDVDKTFSAHCLRSTGL
jgi:hypothetical protein